MGPEWVILSLGARGAIGSSPDGIFEALPPRVDALCPIEGVNTGSPRPTETGRESTVEAAAEIAAVAGNS